MSIISRLSNKNQLAAQLATHFRMPLYRNAYALMLSTAATSGLGIVYWFIAARGYPADVVGTNSAVIATMLFLAGISTLFLDGALVRFLPRAGRAIPRMIGYAYLVSGVTAAIVTGIFLIGIQIWSPALAFLKNDPKLALGFVLGTVTICIFSEQDGALTGLRQATWVPLENTTYAILKIVLLLVFAVSMPKFGIFASWTVPAAILIVMISILIFGNLSGRRMRETTLIQEAPKMTDIARYISANYFGYLFYTAYLMLPPIMVLQFLGARANAYFYLPWIISNSLRLFASNMGSSLVVEGVIDNEKALDYFRKSLVNMARLLIPTVAILFISGPLLLKIFGKDYSTQGIVLLRLLLVGTIPAAIVPLYTGLIRIRNHVIQTILIQAAVAILMLSLSILFLPTDGIAGIGWAYLISHSVVVLFIFATQHKLFHARSKAKARDPETENSSTLSE